MPGEPADIWSVRVDGLWLVSDPNDSGGLGDDWMVARQPIPAGALRLDERDVAPRGRG